MASFGHLFRLLTGRKACVASILAVLFLLLVFGLVPQDGGRDGFLGALGFRNMSGSPLFILSLLFLTLTVTLNAVEDIRHFSRHRLGVTCAHLGLSVVLICGLSAGFGSARARMLVTPGVPTHSGTDERTGEPRKLPFELTLKGFSTDEYSSEVIVTLPDGRFFETVIAVNHPAKVDGWWIYQSDYRIDAERGEFASIFKCVHSPLSGVIRAALWLLLLSAAAMVFFSGFKPRFGKAASRAEDKPTSEGGEWAADGGIFSKEERR